MPGRISRRIKRLALTGVASFRTKRLIVFLTPGFELRTGGVLSIVNTYRESARLGHIHRAKVALCAVPGDPFFLKYSWFENRDYVLDLEHLLKCCGRLEYLQLHIPEYTVNRVVDWLTLAWPTLKQKIRRIHLNIMLQNIDLIRDQNVAGLKSFGRVTCTTAHEAYSKQETRDLLGVTLHKLSIYYGPDRFKLSGYQNKEPLMIVSHDDHPSKERIMSKVAQAFPQLQIRVIRDLSFEDYLNLVRCAKWSLTFGEGLDGYFADQIFSGGVAFAVFNARFFTPAFAELETVYPSWDELESRIATDMKRLDEPEAYRRCWQPGYDLLSSLYSTERFRENLSRFYLGEYTFP